MRSELKSRTTLISLTKNLVYKNIEAQIGKKIRTIVRTLSALQYMGYNNILPVFALG